jgi:hypothetical protein
MEGKMSKLTKFLKHPVLFFQDSKLFGEPDVSEVKKCQNLFFIANYGQLEQIQSLIIYEQLKDCFVCVLYTPANKKMPKLIVDNIDHHLIDGHYLAKLPVSPNRIHIENLISIRKLYSRIISKARPNNIFLLSFEAHYSLIASIANSNNISLSLIEEGTGTYKFDETGKNLAPVVDTKKFARQIFLIKYLPMLSDIRPALGTARKFDHIYAAFPHLLKNVFTYKTLTRFILHAPGGRKLDVNSYTIIQKYKITTDDIIFVSQRYSIEPDLFFNSLFGFLSELSQLTGSKIFIKLHPKETTSSIKAARNTLYNLSQHGNLILIDESNFLIEPTIAYVKPKAIVGIASTSLAYSSLVSPTTAAISLGEYLIPSLLQSGSVKYKEIDVIKSHFDILSKFPNVVSVSNPQMAFEAIEQKVGLVSHSAGVNSDLLIEAHKYAAEGKHWKSHCHYEWSVDGDVAQFNNNQFKKYYLNLLHLRDENLTIKYLPEFVKTIDASEEKLEPHDHYFINESILSVLDVKIVSKQKEIAFELYKYLEESNFIDPTMGLSQRRIFMQLFLGDKDLAERLLEEYSEAEILDRSTVFSLYYLLYEEGHDVNKSSLIVSFEKILNFKCSLNVYERGLIDFYKKNAYSPKKENSIADYFSDFKEKLSNNYRAKFFINKKSKILTVVFQQANQPIRMLERNSNVLYLTDANKKYFTFNPIAQSSYLKDFIENCGFNRVVCTGEGVGGYGAMLWAVSLNKKTTNSNCRCVVLNPVVDINQHFKDEYDLSDFSLFTDIISENDLRNFVRFNKIIEQDLFNLPPTLILASSNWKFYDGTFSDYYNVKSIMLDDTDISYLHQLYGADEIFLKVTSFKPAYFITKF